MSVEAIYIDADIFWHLAAFDRAECEPALGRDNLHNIIDGCDKNPALRVYVPQITLAECLMNAIKGEIDINLVIEYLNKLNPVYESPDSKSMEIKELISSNGYVSNNDALFIAQALSNKNTKIILSTDTEFQSNRLILKIKNDHPKKPNIRSRFKT